MNISQAALSRFTQIRIQKYEEQELENLAKHELELKLSLLNVESSKWLTSDLIFKLREIILDNGFQPRNDIQNLFRWNNFILKTVETSGIVFSVLLGARFHYLPYFEQSVQLKIIEDWWKQSKLDASHDLKSLQEIIKPPGAVHGALEADLKINESIFSLVSNNKLKLIYTGLIFETKNIYNDINEVSKILTCVTIPTCVNQLAHLFASILSGYPILGNLFF